MVSQTVLHTLGWLNWSAIVQPPLVKTVGYIRWWKQSLTTVSLHKSGRKVVRHSRSHAAYWINKLLPSLPWWSPHDQTRQNSWTAENHSVVSHCHFHHHLSQFLLLSQLKVQRVVEETAAGGWGGCWMAHLASPSLVLGDSVAVYSCQQMPPPWWCHSGTHCYPRWKNQMSHNSHKLLIFRISMCKTTENFMLTLWFSRKWCYALFRGKLPSSTDDHNSDLIEILSWHWPRRTDKNQENSSG